MSAFSVNHVSLAYLSCHKRLPMSNLAQGFPYKFVGTVPSRSFRDAPRVITETRTQLNFFSKMVLKDLFPERAFNELLTFAYLERQKIKV